MLGCRGKDQLLVPAVLAPELHCVFRDLSVSAQSCVAYFTVLRVGLPHAILKY